MFSSIFKNRILPSEGARHLFIVILAITVFYIIAFRGILFNSDHVYQNWDNSIPPFSIQLKHLADISKFTWWSSIDMGTPGVWTGMTRYFDMVVLDGLSFFEGKLIIKWFYALIGGIGFWLICRTLGWGLWTTLVVILISQFNPKTYSMVISGHWFQQGFAYSLIPWLFFIFYRTLTASSIWVVGVGIISVGIIGTLMFSATPVGIVSFGVFITLLLIASIFHRQWRKACLYIFTVFLIIIALHLYWIAPAQVISQETDAGFKFSQTREQLSAGYINLYHYASPNLWNAIIGHANINNMASEYVYPVGWIWKIAAYSLLLFAVSGFLFKREQNRNWKIFAILSFIAGIILFAGDKTFIGRLFYEWILFKLKIVFFLMARPTRWLTVYYVGFAMMLGFALNGINNFYKEKPDFRPSWKIVRNFMIFILIIYWFPYWSGSLTKPKNKTSQTLSLMPQKLSDEESVVAHRLTNDPEDYRITVFPTLAGPTGFIPEPPKSNYTRNSQFLGKDHAIGSSHVGSNYSNFLLNLLHREDSYTDNIGRLFGLGAIKRLVQAKNEKYYTYFDFGYLIRPYHIDEGMLFDPGDVLERFLLKQKDILSENDETWKFDSVNIYKNLDFLPRIRAVENAYLASGGMPLFVSMSEMPSNPFVSNALFWGTDLDESSVKKLMPYWKGIVIHNNSWPELLLPFLSKEYWHPANAAGNDISKGWTPLSDVWHSALWLDGSPLNNGALFSRESAEIVFHLKDAGNYRVFVCYGRMPDAGVLSFIFNGKSLASVADKENNQRGFIWKDFGDVNMSGNDNILKVEAGDKGVAIRGLLIVPTKIFNEAMKKLDKSLLDRGNISIIAEAESVSDAGADSKSSKLSIPLIHGNGSDKVKTTMINAKDVSDGTADGRQIVTEGEQAGEVIFEIKFDEEVTRCKLEYYPRFFNDRLGNGFIAAYFSRDGINYQPISKRVGNKSKKMDDIYILRQEDTINCNGDRIFIKFELRLAQLCSLLRGSNTPMRVVGDIKAFSDVVKSSGQAVNLPASFTLDMPKKGKYNIAARIIGKKGEKMEMFASGIKRIFKLKQNGAAWVDMGEVEVKTAGLFNIKLTGTKGILCDLFNIESIEKRDTAAEGVRVKYNRINPAKYEVNLEHKKPTLLLFSESYHPKWYLKVSDKISEPIKVFGFMNAYPIQSVNDSEAVLYFKYQPIMEYYWKISRAGWIIIGTAFVFCVAGYYFGKGKKPTA
jgi:hypothetical protein